MCDDAAGGWCGGGGGGGLLISPSGLHKMDKSVPKLNVLSILYKPPDINPSIHQHTFPPRIRADLLSGNLASLANGRGSASSCSGIQLQRYLV